MSSVESLVVDNDCQYFTHLTQQLLILKQEDSHYKHGKNPMTSGFEWRQTSRDWKCHLPRSVARSPTKGCCTCWRQVRTDQWRHCGLRYSTLAKGTGGSAKFNLVIRSSSELNLTYRLFYTSCCFHCKIKNKNSSKKHRYGDVQELKKTGSCRKHVLNARRATNMSAEEVSSWEEVWYLQTIDSWNVGQWQEVSGTNTTHDHRSENSWKNETASNWGRAMLRSHWCLSIAAPLMWQGDQKLQESFSVATRTLGKN